MFKYWEKILDFQKSSMGFFSCAKVSLGPFFSSNLYFFVKRKHYRVQPILDTVRHGSPRALTYYTKVLTPPPLPKNCCAFCLLMKIGKCINQQILFDELDAFQG
jgi:hypothetical protein